MALTILAGPWNYERKQNLGCAYSLIPALSKKNFYTNKTKPQLIWHHLEFLTSPYVTAWVTLALEEEKANGTEIECRYQGN